MYSIDQYITQLNTDKETLVDNLVTKGIEASDNETFTTLVPKVLDIQSGVDISEYFKIANVEGNGDGYNTFIKKVPAFTSVGTNLQYLFYGLIGLEELPLIDTSNVTNMTNMCFHCQTITTLPQYNTSSVTNFDRFCYGCSSLANVPILNLTNATQINQMFQSCPSLTDTSLDNILQMCINATSYAGGKTLKVLLGQNTSVYPTTRIQALPHYQDFIDAGWTIGY